VATRENDVAIVGAPAVTVARDLNLPRSYYLGTDGFRRDLSPRELAERARAKAGHLWVDIDSTQRHQVAILEKVFNFHPLAIEDTLNPDSRAKVEEYDGFLFMIIRGIRFKPETEDPYDLHTFSLCFFLTPGTLVTVHAEPSRSIAAVADQIDRSPELLARGMERLMHGIMDASVDHYFPIVEQIDEFIDGLEQRVFVSSDQGALHDIFNVKRLVLSLRRHLSPQREVFNILTNRPSALLPAESQVYFRDIYDHVLRINETLETQRELLSSTLEAYLTQVSNRLGLVTKALSVIATLSVPFVVVSGMWGMNFEHIPMSRHPLGFWLMLALQLGIGAGLIALLRWRKWL